MRLNSEQRRIVEHEPSGHMQIKGVAGSGKTTVCVRRVPFLLEHYCHDVDDKVLLVTYNKTLLDFLKYYYEVTKDKLDQQTLFERDDTKLTIVNIDSLMFRYFARYRGRNKLNLKVNTENQKIYLSKALSKTKEKYPKVNILQARNLNFFEDEIDWIKSCDIPDLETYQNISRLGRASGITGVPQKLLKNSTTREAIYYMMESYDALLLQDNMIDMRTMNALALEEARNSKPIFKHILIDECQDLSKVQLEFLKCLYQDKDYSSIMFVADNTQSIYSHSWLGSGRSYTTIGYDMTGKSRTLSKNYRTTAEISQAAYSLIKDNDEIKNNIDFVKPSLIDRHGHPPVYKHFKTYKEQQEFVKSTIESLKDQYRLSDICIVARNNNILKDMNTFLNNGGLKSIQINQKEFDFREDAIRLTTMHSIKGLEFKVVFLIELNQGVIPNSSVYLTEDDKEFDLDERKLLYVGMTRANELLYMSSSIRPSKFIKEINFDYLRSSLNTRLKPYYQVMIQNYLFKSKIVDIHSKEEAVRQWWINELIENYHYPQEMLELEHPVQDFSRMGFVDLSVNIFIENKKQPFIFFEFKQPNQDLDTAIAQLKSYMQVENVSFGVISNGLDTIFINKNHEVIEDIPQCQTHFLPESNNKYTFINFNSNEEFVYLINKDDSEQIDIINKSSERHVDSENFIKIPILGRLTNILSISETDHFEERIIDSSWALSKKDTYFIEAEGDSMINAGIHNGDLILIQTQNIYNQSDLVIVSFNEEIMIKEILKAGSDVILTSKNNDYEPIIMNESDIIVHAKVIGVLQG